MRRAEASELSETLERPTVTMPTPPTIVPVQRTEQHTEFRGRLSRFRYWAEGHPYITMPVGLALTLGAIAGLSYLTAR